MMQGDFQLDLTTCDREPIHVPGAIQPHGCLLALSGDLTVVHRVSANAAAMLEAPELRPGTSTDTVLGRGALHRLRNALLLAIDRPALLFAVEAREGSPLFDIAIHRSGEEIVVEFEPAEEGGGAPLEISRTLMARIRRIDQESALIQQAVRLVRGTTGYDRVMAYAFQEDGSGKVIAETKRNDLESFLGQYFPAADIPIQARALYLRNTIRIISDASDHRVPLLPEVDDQGRKLDLSQAHLRAVSPIHCEYLRNMGVGASMSISIVVDGRLWGLIACHHYESRVLPMSLRVSMEMFGEFLSLQLSSLQRQEKLEVAREVRATVERLTYLGSTTPPDRVLVRSLPDLAQVLHADGAALLIDGLWTETGSTPPPGAARGIVADLRDVAQGRVWSTNALSSILPEAAEYHEAASGLLIIPLSQLPRDYMFFFRKEIIQSLDWAGDPNKTYTTGPHGDRLTPRRSFAIWKETVYQQSRPWTVQEIDAAESIRSAITEILLRHSELLADERDRAALRQRVLNDELNHRVKNVLALIKSLIGQPVVDGGSLRDYVEDLRGRIQALAYAHDQVIRGEDGGMLDDLMRAELGPYLGHAVTLSGEPVHLDVRAFPVLALVLHEMATNAAKYGALSEPEGRLLVEWQRRADGAVAITWTESGGPEVVEPKRDGFGSTLITRSIPHDLDGEAEVTFAPEGLRARFLIPSQHVTSSGLTAETAYTEESMSLPKPESQAQAPAHDLNILLVEDQVLIAMDVEAMLGDLGYDNVSAARASGEALSMIERAAPDLAVLDVNLGRDTSFPVAEELIRRKIPFIFATGYGDSSIIPSVFEKIPVVQKPYEAEMILAALSREQARLAGKV
ncbi:signal transduction histidine kinase [Haematobacter missouriensis]|uniref:histidine kinase n=2 Tax=Haematobacter missouriensis TaxID=366616 RepID=A0ABX3ZP29_9RHOB|nr:signal transduction histidine kinase [Haematobacter missouriensis]